MVLVFDSVRNSLKKEENKARREASRKAKEALENLRESNTEVSEKEVIKLLKALVHSRPDGYASLFKTLS